MPTGRGRAFARAALAGNPSDGYGGRTLAVVVRDFEAVAEARGARADALDPPGPGGDCLLAAARDRFRRELAPVGPVALSCRTTVPREVGLAGSSAIVIAALRALAELADLSLEPDSLARTALAVETEDLGIAAGLQDRVVQAREALVAMDFGAGASFEELDPRLLPPLYVAWRPDAAEPSGNLHGRLRERHRRGDPEVRGALAELARLAAAGRDALLARDRERFAACVDGSLDVRRRIVPVDPRILAIAELARAHGASANSAGSGGAIVGSLPDERAWPALRTALERAGCGVVRPRVSA